MMAIDLLKEKLASLEQNIPHMEQRLESLTERKNKNLNDVDYPIHDILSLDKEKMKKIKNAIELQIHIDEQTEMIKESIKMINDYEKAIERLEVES